MKRVGSKSGGLILERARGDSEKQNAALTTLSARGGEPNLGFGLWRILLVFVCWPAVLAVTLLYGCIWSMIPRRVAGLIVLLAPDVEYTAGKSIDPRKGDHGRGWENSCRGRLYRYRY